MPKKRTGRSTHTRTPTRSPNSSPTRSPGASGTTVLAFILGAAAAAGAGYLYLRSTPPTPSPTPQTTVATQPAPAVHGRPPDAVTPPTRTPPFGTSEDVFEAGATLYSSRCASCHGTPRKDSATNSTAMQLFRKGRHAASAQPPGVLYSEIATGAAGKGMPAYAHVLTDTQIWQLALLLKNADADLPDPVTDILNAASR